MPRTVSPAARIIAVLRMDARLQDMAAVRAAVSLCLVLGMLACEAESQLAPATPVKAALTEPTCVQSPALEDSFPEAFDRSDRDYHTQRPPSIDLGAIGDTPLGREPPPVHKVPYWQQPFPCDWTNTCRMSPVVYVGPGAYGLPPPTMP